MEAAIRDFLAKEFGLTSPRAVSEATKLREELWLDDLGLLELGEYLQSKLSFRVDAKEWDEIFTVGDLTRRLVQQNGSLIVSSLAPEVSGADTGRVRWVVKVGGWNPSKEEWTRALSLLPTERREKVLRYKFDTDKQLHLVGQLLLRRLIHEHLGTPYEDIRFAYTKGNKPVLGFKVPSTCRFKNYNFNYSHEGDYIVAGSEPCSIVGVDVAKVQIRGADKGIEEYFDTMHKCFLPNEWVSIYSGRDAHEKLFRFYVLWALKESYVKVRERESES